MIGTARFISCAEDSDPIKISHDCLHGIAAYRIAFANQGINQRHFSGLGVIIYDCILNYRSIY
jgi:hypothetical protein